MRSTASSLLRLRRMDIVAAILLVASPALAQFNLPQPSTALPGRVTAPPTPTPRIGPPPAANLPPASALPAPGDTRLPGVDPRQCGPTPHSALCAAGRWTQFSTMDMRVTAPGFKGAYTLRIAANDEVHATYRETANGTTRSGEVVLMGMDGVAFRSAEKFPEGAPVLDIMISMPIMTAQLVALLLDQGVIGPPADVSAPRTIRAANATQYIRTAAPSTAILYGAPWKMDGTVRPGSAAGTIAFALRFAYRPVDSRGNPQRGRTDSIAIDGTVSFAPRAATLPDGFDLTGFTLLRDEKKIAAQPTLGAARRVVTP